MGSMEFSWWMAYDRRHPFGDDRTDLGFAIVAVTLANIHRPKDQPPYQIEDFTPKFGETELDTKERVRKEVDKLFQAPPPRKSFLRKKKI